MLGVDFQELVMEERLTLLLILHLAILQLPDVALLNFFEPFYLIITFIKHFLEPLELLGQKDDLIFHILPTRGLGLVLLKFI